MPLQYVHNTNNIISTRTCTCEFCKPLIGAVVQVFVGVCILCVCVCAYAVKAIDNSFFLFLLFYFSMLCGAPCT